MFDTIEQDSSTADPYEISSDQHIAAWVGIVTRVSPDVDSARFFVSAGDDIVLQDETIGIPKLYNRHFQVVSPVDNVASNNGVRIAVAHQATMNNVVANNDAVDSSRQNRPTTAVVRDLYALESIRMFDVNRRTA